MPGQKTSLVSVSQLRPIQVLVQEIKRALAVDGVRPDEPLDLAAVADAEPGLVQVLHLGKLVAHRLVRGYAVEVAALDHEWPRCDQRGHLGVVERATQVEFKNLVLAMPYVAVPAARRGVLPHPLVEIRRADREAIVTY